MFSLILLFIFSCKKSEQPVKWAEFWDGQNIMDRPFYGQGDDVHILSSLVLKFGKNTDQNLNIVPLIMGEYNNINLKFTDVSSKSSNGYIYSSGKAKFQAKVNSNILNIKYKFSDLDPQEFDSKLDIVVFENRKIDFLFDKLIPNKMRSSFMGEIWANKGAGKLEKQETSRMYDEEFKTIIATSNTLYKDFKEKKYGLFEGLYGYSKIYGGNQIDSVIVDFGDLNRDQSLIYEKVIEDVKSAYPHFKEEEFYDSRNSIVKVLYIGDIKVSIEKKHSNASVYAIVKRI